MAGSKSIRTIKIRRDNHIDHTSLYTLVYHAPIDVDLFVLSKLLDLHVGEICPLSLMAQF